MNTTPASNLPEPVREYAERDHMALADLYVRHFDAMTREGLDRKSDIAAELAYRDSVIAALTARVSDLEADRDSWRDQASDRVKDWDEMRQRAEQAEAQAEAHARDAERLLAAADDYYLGYCQDEASDDIDGDGKGHWTGCDRRQRDAARELRDAVKAMKEPKPK